MTNIHHLLWTSGWDSTFRLFDLAIRQGEPVQPSYAQFPDRLSTRAELKTQKKIRAAVA
ncbi:hypothetical protein [Parenemella sanctibonifatiensis]|uniref:hypothetical protein n=1 Tax=Parenemella sanctibonifatiensis TaxID=2016505 RepID=UPI0015C65D5F|nr:hypothetical protein [Parenemella sanctibonifatiensis]